MSIWSTTARILSTVTIAATGHAASANPVTTNLASRRQLRLRVRRQRSQRACTHDCLSANVRRRYRHKDTLSVSHHIIAFDGVVAAIKPSTAPPIQQNFLALRLRSTTATSSAMLCDQSAFFSFALRAPHPILRSNTHTITHH